MDPRGENLVLQYFMQYFAGVDPEDRGPKYGAAVFQTATESTQNLDGGRGADIVALTLSDYQREQIKQNRRSCTLKQNLR
jgi:hypothetical protein